MSEAWPQYVAGVLVLATGAAASALYRTWRRRRPAPQNPDTATDQGE